MNRIGLIVLATSGLLLAGGLTGCSGDDKPDAGPPATMIAPGRPGEPNKTITVGPGTPTPPTAADVTFVQMMIPHHQQALEMSALAAKQASNSQVKALAGRIDASQGAEISAMQSWLKLHGRRQGGGHGGHGAAPGPTAMPGMATPEQMKQLQGAQGAAFDRLFLNLMIRHHEGALTMAGDALRKGTDVTVQEMAKDTLTTQRAEIGRMRDILESV